jgi:D-3-phosphoglycerate dehydrogenase / 2-oxoglutarate reductase
MKILVAEPMAPAAVDMLKAQEGWDVVVSDPKGYAAHLADCDALLVRSAVKVNKDVLSKAPKLSVVGRAGVGVDNVDLDAATEAGVLVMNTPGGNAVSVAEHTLGLMLAMARSIPQASASTKSGKWEKKKFLGNELRGKTLGILGLGSIGREVARRARSFEMRIVAFDPYVNPQTAKDLGIELAPLGKVYPQSDYISMHVALTPETQGMINDASISQMKQGVRIVNCARGELIDGAALARGLESGKIGGAALDVFQMEPPAAGEPLLAFENVIATPHIGGSTEEAQEIVGIRIVEQLISYLREGVALNAVNLPSITAEQYKAVGPYVALAEQLGAFASHIAEGNPKTITLVYSGRIGEQTTHVIRNSGVAGALSRSAARRPNIVNAMQIAKDRGINVGERTEDRTGPMDSIRLILESEGGLTTVEGAVVLGKPRLIAVDGIYCEAPLSGHLSFMKNADVPGVIGYIGTVFGKNGVNIASFSLGRRDASAPGAPAEAIAVIETDQKVSDAVLQEVLQNKAVVLARSVEFE